MGEHEVEKYPTLKWGHPEYLEDYQGQLDFDSLDKFSQDNLKPLCSMAAPEHCDSEQQGLVAEFKNLTAREVKAKIKVEEKAFAELQKWHSKQRRVLDKETRLLKKQSRNISSVVDFSCPRVGPLAHLQPHRT